MQFGGDVHLHIHINIIIKLIAEDGNDNKNVQPDGNAKRS